MGGAVGGGVTSAATLLRICKGSMAGYGDHRHCRSCGDLMAYTKGDYDRHYCCFWTDKFGLPRCSERDPDHSS